MDYCNRQGSNRAFDNLRQVNRRSNYKVNSDTEYRTDNVEQQMNNSGSFCVLVCSEGGDKGGYTGADMLPIIIGIAVA